MKNYIILNLKGDYHERKKEKLKVWLVEYKNDIKMYTCYAAGICFGYFAATKISDYKNATGLSVLHSEGIVKFFDPSNGAEIGIRKACDIVKQMNK